MLYSQLFRHNYKLCKTLLTHCTFLKIFELLGSEGRDQDVAGNSNNNYINLTFSCNRCLSLLNIFYSECVDSQVFII